MLSLLIKTSLIEETYIEGIQTDEENKNAFRVPVVELIRVIEYLSNPKVSTQHSIKGKSYDIVTFVADDIYSNTIVHMYGFFKMWGETN